MSKPVINSVRSENPSIVLEVLFNSKIRVKILKFLFRNHPARIGVLELAGKVQESSGKVSHDMAELEKIGLIKRV